MITEDYVSFETAKLLKEKGYCNESIVFYKENGELIHYNVPLNNKGISDTLGVFYEAPTLQMAMKWLRKEKGIAIIPVLSSILDNEKFLWDIKIVVAKTGEKYSQGWIYEKQEDAFNTAIKYCLESLV